MPPPRTALDLGAHIEPNGGVTFRVLAPKCKRVEVVIDSAILPLACGADGVFIGTSPGARAGSLYRLVLDGRDEPLPDPASRFQPQGPHGPSEVVDPNAFAWTDGEWRGVTMRGQVLYEMHIGTFTEAGTYRAAISELSALHDLGITLIELMPVAEFPGRFGWGYDGVDLYAPFHRYGPPDDLRAFVNEAHALGLGVLLDVVYNHLGPDGNYLERFSDAFFTDKYANEWGRAIDFETDPRVRAFFVENAAHWVREYHLDGLRLDATQCILDASPVHVLAEMAAATRAAAGTREIVLIAENEPQHAKLVRPKERGGYGLSAIWNDDFHHSAIVALTGRREAYYGPTNGTPQELASALKWGFVYQGQYYDWQKKARGTPALDVPPERFVLFLENHDQIANTGLAARPTAHGPIGAYRALTAAMLLAPGTPLLFQGQEFAATSEFHFFADHRPELRDVIANGRRAYLEQFETMRDPATESIFLRPDDARAFMRSKLDHREKEKPPHALTLAFHRALLRLRREDPVFSAQRSDWMHGIVLTDRAFALRYLTGDAQCDRLVVVNLGSDLDLERVHDPLLAPPEGAKLVHLFSTEDPRWGGAGTPPIRENGSVRLPARSALVLAAVTAER